jgi:hypothetical protein
LACAASEASCLVHVTVNFHLALSRQTSSRPVACGLPTRQCGHFSDFSFPSLGVSQRPASITKEPSLGDCRSSAAENIADCQLVTDSSLHHTQGFQFLLLRSIATSVSWHLSADSDPGRVPIDKLRHQMNKKSSDLLKSCLAKIPRKSQRERNVECQETLSFPAQARVDLVRKAAGAKRASTLGTALANKLPWCR